MLFNTRPRIGQGTLASLVGVWSLSKICFFPFASIQSPPSSIPFSQTQPLVSPHQKYRPLSCGRSAPILQVAPKGPFSQSWTPSFSLAIFNFLILPTIRTRKTNEGNVHFRVGNGDLGRRHTHFPCCIEILAPTRMQGNFLIVLFIRYRSLYSLLVYSPLKKTINSRTETFFAGRQGGYHRVKATKRGFAKKPGRWAISAARYLKWSVHVLHSILPARAGNVTREMRGCAKRQKMLAAYNEAKAEMQAPNAEFCNDPAKLHEFLFNRTPQ